MLWQGNHSLSTAFSMDWSQGLQGKRSGRPFKRFVSGKRTTARVGPSQRAGCRQPTGQEQRNTEGYLGMSSVLKASMRSVADIPVQPASEDIWDKKYRLKAKDGTILDETVDHTWQRVARALADVETTKKKREFWYERFLWALRHGAIPAGRITSNAGAQEHKPATSTINCTVSGTIRDSMDDILGKVHEAGLTLK